MGASPDTQIDDQEVLDRLFDLAVERIEEGLPVEAEHLIQGRHELRPQVEQLIRLAQQVAVGQLQSVPTIRGYTILGELGRGGMGTVYLARQERLGGRPVALKVLSPSVALSPRARERFRAEARAIARLHHPNIVAVHDVVQESGVYAYAMEWIEGRSLAELIDHLRHLEGPPSLADVRELLSAPANAIRRGTVTTFICEVGTAVARALSAVHREGLLHRDVKPSNILLRRDGTPLLTDFGLARETQDATLTQAGHFVGTPAYAAPEQLRGSPDDLDARTDVYGLGATLYHALACKIPFPGRSTADILRQIEAGSAEPLRQAKPWLSRDLQTVVAKALEPEPARRYQTADEMADDLERLLNLQPIRARPAGLLTRTAKLARRNRRALAAAIVGALFSLTLAVVFGVYWFLVPGWVKGHIDEARLALLDPSAGDRAFSVVSRGIRSGDHPFTLDNLETALASYHSALKWAPVDEAIRLERDIIVLAQDISRGSREEPTIAVRLDEKAPLACSYARRWVTAGRPPLLDSEQLQRASAADLRSLGLLAFLCQDVHTSLQAWSQLDLREEPDPLVEASLGQLYLAVGDPALAYPRLRNAFQTFPEVGFLCVSLADAALQCGDVQRAERLLQQARGMERLDRTHGLERVEADLYAATGRDGLARQRYERLRQDRLNFVAVYNYGQFLEARGELREALQVYQEEIERSRNVVRVHRAFVDLADRWWNALSPNTRWMHLRGAFDEDPVEPDSFVRLLRGFAASTAFLANRETRKGLDIPQPASKWGTMPRPARGRGGNPATKQMRVQGVEGRHHPGVQTSLSAGADPVVGAREPSSLLQNMSLSALADRMDVGSVLRWSRRRAYPPILKDLQVIAWIQRNPITLPEFADRLCRPWRTLQFARRHGDPAGAAAIARSVATLWAPTNTVVPPSFVIEVLLAPIAGTRPRLEAIRNPDYGEGVIAASVDDGALKIRRINGSTVELLATGPDTGAGFHAPQVGTIRFDTTGLFGNELYVCLWGDIGGTRGLWDRTIVLRISAEGEVTRVAVCGNEIEPVAVLLEFAAGHGGYRRGAYLGQFAWNPRPRPANDLYHMSVAFNITKLAQDVLPPGRTNLTVWAMEFDPTGLYGSYLTLADSDDDDALTAVYQLRPDLSWSELTTLVSRWGRLYGDLAFSPGGGFGQKLYVTDRVSQSVMTVDPNGVHREFAMGFCGIDSVTISQDGDQMFVSDADGVYRIRPISRP